MSEALDNRNENAVDGRLAEAIRPDPAGTGALGTVVGAIVLIFLVLLVTDILGFTKVFPFTRTAN